MVRLLLLDAKVVVCLADILVWLISRIIFEILW